MIEPYYQEDGITLYCARAEEVLPQLQDKSIDMIFTDPPYGHNNNNGDMISRREAIFEGRKEAYNEETEFRPIVNDGEETNDLVRWAFPEFHRLLVKGGCCCCCGGGGGPDPQFVRWAMWLNEAFNDGFKMMVVWDKGPMGMGHHYRRSYETVLVAQRGGAACKWHAGTKDIENVIRPGDYGIRKIIPSAKQHPTEKPVELAEHFIRLHSLSNELVLDPFAGHGTALLAAKRLGRRAIGIEMSEDYCQIAVRRLGQKELFGIENGHGT